MRTPQLSSLSCVCGLLIFLGMSESNATAAQPPPRPNVLFITVDDMNWDSVGVFGCPVPDITPNIDRLASEGLRFQHAHVTIAICQPTRAVWMTGRYPHRSGALGFDPIDAGVPTLPEALKQAGFHLGLIGKESHVIPTRRQVWDVSVSAGQLQQGRNPDLYHRHSKRFFEEAKSQEKPFFLMANAHDPHRPFAGSAQEAARKNPRAQAKKKKQQGGANFPGVRRTYRPDEIAVPGFLPDLPDIRQELSEYFASVHRADEVVGAVLRALRETGLEESTLVMFKSDHGMPLPFAKTNCWMNSTRTPWIVRWPGVVQAGSVDDRHFVSGIDFAPTILEAAGLPPLEGADGRSFLPVLKGESQPGCDKVFTHINTIASKRSYPMRSVQTAKFGYIFNAWADGQTLFRNESQAGLTMNAMTEAARTNPQIAARVKHFLYRTPEEFYDYERDPDARHNLIDDPNYRDKIDEFRQRLLEHLKSTGDPQLKAFQGQFQTR
jgi:N-sulfoglucosamine sulfohydrolase